DFSIGVEIHDRYAIVRLDRPPVNAINRPMMRALREAFEQLTERREINSVVLCAAGSRAFCAGVDLREAAPPEPSGVRDVIDPNAEWRQTQLAVRQCAVPVIAAVEHP